MKIKKSQLRQLIREQVLLTEEDLDEGLWDSIVGIFEKLTGWLGDLIDNWAEQAENAITSTGDAAFSSATQSLGGDDAPSDVAGLDLSQRKHVLIWGNVIADIAPENNRKILKLITPAAKLKSATPAKKDDPAFAKGGDAQKALAGLAKAMGQAIGGAKYLGEHNDKMATLYGQLKKAESPAEMMQGLAAYASPKIWKDIAAPAVKAAKSAKGTTEQDQAKEFLSTYEPAIKEALSALGKIEKLAAESAKRWETAENKVEDATNKKDEKKTENRHIAVSKSSLRKIIREHFALHSIGENSRWK